MAEEENEHANKFMEYQNKRGGTIVLLDIKVCSSFLHPIRMFMLYEFQKPQQQSWSSPLEAHEAALQLEKDVYQALLELHAFACKNKYVTRFDMCFSLTLLDFLAILTLLIIWNQNSSTNKSNQSRNMPITSPT